MTEKHKHEDRPFGKYVFLGLWILTHCIVAILGPLVWNVLIAVLPLDFLQLPISTILMNVLLTLAVMALVGFVQQVVIYQYWSYRIHQWWWVTALGFALVSFVTNLLLNMMASDMPQDWMQSDSLWIFVLITGFTSAIALGLQALLLQSYFVRAWWYVIINVVFGIVATMLIPPNLIVNQVIFGLISGITLLWLDHITGKHKNSDKQ